MLDGNYNRYVELTTRLRSVEAFCDFLAHGGTIRVAASESAPFTDVTLELLQRQRREADALRQTRRHLFPEHADEDFQQTLYGSH
ncbi:hypothetical protein FHT86_004567 [Rhizobium sp. BK313]|uniref:hypothetical protein n=1 Tax=Rhizobium sp. BK313 TaxID=2587081 RepID=UPI0010CF644E|nr:hypothetical protein [Rhizobium sp. BK313]MBB3456259.1 hypothetical protein [Rhizobium sp. BK313]